MLAKAFNQLFVMINKFEKSLNNHPYKNKSELEDDLFILAYLCRNQILDRTQRTDWTKSPRIFVPQISTKSITIASAYRQTVDRVKGFGKKLEVAEKINNILIKGTTYYTIHKKIPIEYKHFK
jgi:hypothetical protein